MQAGLACFTGSGEGYSVSIIHLPDSVIRISSDFISPLYLLLS